MITQVKNSRVFFTQILHLEMFMAVFIFIIIIIIIILPPPETAALEQIWVRFNVFPLWLDFWRPGEVLANSKLIHAKQTDHSALTQDSNCWPLLNYQILLCCHFDFLYFRFIEMWFHFWHFRVRYFLNFQFASLLWHSKSYVLLH